MKMWTLELPDRSAFRPKAGGAATLELRRVQPACAELNRVMHAVVGSRWKWGGRTGWGHEQWRAYVLRDEVVTWLAYVAARPVGYCEVERQADGSVKIMCFGLLPDFIGQGLGGTFITQAVRRCWELGADKVWLDTCSNDHPNALGNYLARGFRIVREAEYPD